MVGVTRAGIVHEYEIKLTRSDLKADLKKFRHLALTHWFEGTVTPGSVRPFGMPANYFWYVMPSRLAAKLGRWLPPPYAGVLLVEDSIIALSRQAPRLHREKITEKQRMQPLHSACTRFWSARRILTEQGIPFTEDQH